MERKKYSKKEIAELFSNGDFEQTFPFLSENVEWEIIGENFFMGKEKVIQNCNRTAQYFKSLQTDFKTEDVVVAKNKVVVRGSAEFIRDGKE
ncbi:MAG: hypothetical protein AAF806_25325 [Bacteroidota bacterium]